MHLYAAAIVLQRVVCGISGPWPSFWLLATGIYTIAGGLAAVIYTDPVQTIILLLGALALTWIGLTKLAVSHILRTIIPDSYFHMFHPASDPEFPWTGIVFGAPILGLWYWCTDQVIVQRVLSAKDEAHAKAGTIFAGFLKFLPVFHAGRSWPHRLCALSANLHQGKRPGHQRQLRFPALMLNLLPTGLVGLMIAALLAALMGAMSSVFNSASTMVTLDFYKKIAASGLGKAAGVLWAVATGVMVILGLLWVPFIDIFSTQLWIYLQSVQAYISPPIAVCFILGILWTRMNGQGAIIALWLVLFSAPCASFSKFAITPRALPFPFIRSLVDLNFLHYAIFMFVVCSVVLIGVSLMFPAPDRKSLPDSPSPPSTKRSTPSPSGPPTVSPPKKPPLSTGSMSCSAWGWWRR